jgi:thermostable 8-oxoguanine DNA glycosylase
MRLQQPTRKQQQKDTKATSLFSFRIFGACFKGTKAWRWQNVYGDDILYKSVFCGLRNQLAYLGYRLAVPSSIDSTSAGFNARRGFAGIPA